MQVEGNKEIEQQAAKEQCLDFVNLSDDFIVVLG